VEAARLFGLTEVPTLRITGLSAAQQRAYVVADNRLAELAGWDRALLRTELSGLIDLGFEVEVTGFETTEIDLMIGADGASTADLADDNLPKVNAGPAVSRPGDLWQLGAHRLLCADALDFQAYARVMAGDLAQLVFTDPP
jgi:hypothetical protein